MLSRPADTSSSLQAVTISMLESPSLGFMMLCLILKTSQTNTKRGRKSRGKSRWQPSRYRLPQGHWKLSCKTAALEATVTGVQGLPAWLKSRKLPKPMHSSTAAPLTLYNPCRQVKVAQWHMKSIGGFPVTKACHHWYCNSRPIQKLLVPPPLPMNNLWDKEQSLALHSLHLPTELPGNLSVLLATVFQSKLLMKTFRLTVSCPYLKLQWHYFRAKLPGSDLLNTKQVCSHCALWFRLPPVALGWVPSPNINDYQETRSSLSLYFLKQNKKFKLFTNQNLRNQTKEQDQPTKIWKSKLFEKQQSKIL